MIDQPSSDDSPPLFAVYASELRLHAIEWIWLGFHRLVPGAWAITQEDDITGAIVEQMKLAAANAASPAWTEYYSVAEQQPINAKDKTGKRRPKIDIEIERHTRGPRPRLSFEAKRLGRGNGPGDYLGEEGLGAFLDQYYPTTHEEAGMLGYMQEGTCEIWAGKLAAALAGKRAEYKLSETGDWRDVEGLAPNMAFQTNHVISEGGTLLVLHVLLPMVAT